MNREIKLSKKLSRVLRHRAPQLGIRMRTDGNVDLEELLRHPSFQGVTRGQVSEVVANNDKKRFELTEEDNRTFIRAAQGHTIQGISDEELLTPLDDPYCIPMCVHGTKERFLSSILANGLNRMTRNHIHMAVGLPGSNGVISGMRNTSEIAIVIDVSKAISAGIKFYRSSNNVILSPGIRGEGTIPSDYFAEVIDLRNGRRSIHQISASAGGDNIPQNSVNESSGDTQAGAAPIQGTGVVPPPSPHCNGGWFEGQRSSHNNHSQSHSSGNKKARRNKNRNS